MLSVLSRFPGLRPLTALKTSRTVSSYTDLPLGSNVFTFSVKLSTVETPRVGRTYNRRQIQEFLKGGSKLITIHVNILTVALICFFSQRESQF